MLNADRPSASSFLRNCPSCPSLVSPTLKQLLAALLLSLGFATLAPAASGPIRVLYFDAQGTEQTSLGPLHGAMRELGRDAIWFDYATGPTPSRAHLTPYDVLAMRPNADGTPPLILDRFPNGGPFSVIKVDDGASPEQIRQDLLASIPAERKANWEAFLSRREPEQREPNPNVANYERRPQAVTFQHPFSVQGSKERTMNLAGGNSFAVKGEIPGVTKASW